MEIFYTLREEGNGLWVVQGADGTWKLTPLIDKAARWGDQEQAEEAVETILSSPQPNEVKTERRALVATPIYHDGKFWVVKN